MVGHAVGAPQAGCCAYGVRHQPPTPRHGTPHHCGHLPAAQGVGPYPVVVKVGNVEEASGGVEVEVRRAAEGRKGAHAVSKGGTAIARQGSH